MFRFDSQEKTFIFPFYKSPFKFQQRVDLLLIGNDKKWHYICIKNLKAILRWKGKHKGKIIICPNCYKRVFEESEFTKHQLVCKSIDDTNPVEEMPKDTKMKFKNFKYRQRNAITIYAGTLIKSLMFCFGWSADLLNIKYTILF